MPNDIVPAVAEKRRELIEAISEVDEELADLFLNDHPITPDELAVCTILCTISSFHHFSFLISIFPTQLMYCSLFVFAL
jgi:hypothetical protein